MSNRSVAESLGAAADEAELDDVFARWARAPVRFTVAAPGADPSLTADPVVASRILRGSTRALVPGVSRQSSESVPRGEADDDLEENVHAALRPAVALRPESSPAAVDDPADPPLMVLVYAREERGPVGRRLTLEPGVLQVTIGRTLDNVMVLEDTSVSRRHAMLTRTDEGWWLADLGSTNGTFVNGERVKDALLRDGDRVRLGSVILHALLDAPCASRLGALFAEVLAVDVLTRAATARALDAEVARWESAEGLDGARAGVVVLDLDGLRGVNQRYGELVGDEVIVSLASRLREVVPSGATLARLGGGEFAVWMPSAVEGEAEALAAALALHVAQSPLALDDSRVAATVTARGVSCRLGESPPVATLEALRESVRGEKRRRASGGVGGV